LYLLTESFPETTTSREKIMNITTTNKATNSIGKALGALLLLTCACTHQAFAGSGGEEHGHWYFGVGLASTDLQTNEKNMSATYGDGSYASFDHSGTAFKLFAGYQVDPFLGLEAGVTSFGEIVMTDSQAKRNLFNTSGVYIAATATRPVSKNINAQAKLGMFFWSLDDKNAKTLEDGQGLTYGAGLDINLYGGKERTLLVEWEHHSFSGVALEEANSIGVSLKFAMK
jgi:hypothetical protein